MAWIIEPAHSSIDFTVRHLGLSNVRGRFGSFSGRLETDAEGKPVSVEVTIDPASIDTGVEDRDNHLRSPDFFDVANHPEITFRSNSVTAVSEDRYTIDGDLTIRGTTRPFSLEVEASGPVPSPFGGQVGAANGSGTVNRKDFGLTWNQVLETGGLLVGENVKFGFDLELVEAD